MSDGCKAVAASVLVQVGFGCYGIVFKPWAHKVDTLIFCLMRDTGGFLVLLLAATLKEGFTVPPRCDVCFFALCGVFGMFGGQVLYLIAVAMCGPAIASIYQPLIPVFTAILAILTGIEKPFPCSKLIAMKFGGILLGSGGAVTMVLGSTQPHKKAQAQQADQEHNNILLGNLLLIFECMCTAIFILLQKQYVYDAKASSTADKYTADLPSGRRQRWIDKPISMTAWAYCSGATCMWLVAIPYSCFRPHIWRMPASIVIPLAYAVFVASAMCYALITYANRVLSATVTTSFWPLQVLIATALASYCYGEHISTQDAVGGALIVMGMLVIAWSNHYQARVDASSGRADSSGGGGRAYQGVAQTAEEGGAALSDVTAAASQESECIEDVEEVSLSMLKTATEHEESAAVW